MPFTAVYDANVLYPSTTRDLLIRVAQAGLVHARWTNAILDEVFDSLRRSRPDLDPAKLDRTRTLMSAAIRDVLVVNFEALIPAFTLPDPDDRHVLAAIRARAQLIVTWNTKTSPRAPAYMRLKGPNLWPDTRPRLREVFRIGLNAAPASGTACSASGPSPWAARRTPSPRPSQTAPPPD